MGNLQGVSADDILRREDSLENLSIDIVNFWPEPPKPNIPEFLPTDVARTLNQAESNFVQENHEEASAVMYRKAFELGLKSINKELKGTLANRIEQLGKQGKLTDDLVTWAKEIKNLGNDGAHDDEAIDHKELEALRGLTEMVLKYLFTLPKMIEQRRETIKGTGVT